MSRAFMLVKTFFWTYLIWMLKACINTKTTSFHEVRKPMEGFYNFRTATVQLDSHHLQCHCQQKKTVNCLVLGSKGFSQQALAIYSKFDTVGLSDGCRVLRSQVSAQLLHCMLSSSPDWSYQRVSATALGFTCKPIRLMLRSARMPLANLLVCVDIGWGCHGHKPMVPSKEKRGYLKQLPALNEWSEKLVLYKESLEQASLNAAGATLLEEVVRNLINIKQSLSSELTDGLDTVVLTQACK
eukprot:2197423-Amphidinium_carterae.2